MIRYLWPSIVWSITVVILTLIPGEELPNVPVVGIDKLVHVFIFALMMTLTAFGLHKSSLRQSLKNRALISFAYSFIFGIIIELIQPFVPGRSFSYFDIVANMIGVAIGYLGYVFLRRHYI
jgi:VanZ family protein